MTMICVNGALRNREEQVRLSDRLSSRTIIGSIRCQAQGPERLFVKGKPVAASHASSSGNQESRARGNRRRRHEGEAGITVNDAGTGDSPFDEVMEQPAPRLEPSVREDVMCVRSFASRQEQPPFHNRRGLATVRRRLVDKFGAARLYCDCLHEGPHAWPPVYERLTDATVDESLPDDGVDEGKIVDE